MNGIQYSKLLPIFTGLLFSFTLANAFCIDLNNVMDTTLYVTCVTVSGGIFATTVLAYLKKATVENNIKVRTLLYKEISNQQLLYNEKMMELKNKYNVTDEDVSEIENNSEINNKTTDTFSSADSIIDESLCEASSIEEKNF